MNLYYVCGEDDDGYNCSLFVYADTPEQAFEFWKASEEGGQFSGDYFENTLSTASPSEATENDLRIFEVPQGPTTAGPIPWHQKHGVHCVAFAEEV